LQELLGGKIRERAGLSKEPTGGGNGSCSSRLSSRAKRKPTTARRRTPARSR
jgi:hypothetical protein